MPSHANPVNWFEIPVNDMDRARKFYEAGLGLEVTIMDMGPKLMGWFPMVMGAAGAAGTLVCGDGYTPSREGSLVYLHVDEIDRTLAAIDSAGGRTLLPRTPIGEHGFIAHFQDCEGNRVALHESPQQRMRGIVTTVRAGAGCGRASRSGGSGSSAVGAVTGNHRFSGGGDGLIPAARDLTRGHDC